MVSKKIDITKSGSPTFDGDSDPVYKDITDKTNRFIRSTEAQSKQSDKNSFDGMLDDMDKLKGYTSQVTPGDWKKKDNLK